MYISDIIKELTAEVSRCKEESEKNLEKAKKAKAVIETIQDLCDHEYVADGYDSHKSYWKCTYCGRREKT